MEQTAPRHRFFRVTVLLALLAYSIVHIGHATSRAPLSGALCTSDFYFAFPAPFVAKWNPGLVASFQASPQHPHMTQAYPTMWFYGPMLHAVTLPLTLLPTNRAVCFVWQAITLAFAVAAGILVYRAFFPGTPFWPRGAVYWILWLNFYPLLETIGQGNIEVFELFLLAVAFYLLFAGSGVTKPAPAARHIMAGVAVGVAAMTKFLPLVFVPYLVLKRRWRAAAGATVTILVIAAVAQPLLDWRENITMARATPIAPTPHGYSETTVRIASDSDNQGLSKLVLLAFSEPLREPWNALRTIVIAPDSIRTAFRTVEIASATVAALAAALLIWRRASPHVDLEVSLLLTIMVFIPPYSHDYYQVFLIVPLAVLLRRTWLDASARWIAAPLGALAYVLMGSFFVPQSLIGRALGWPPTQVRYLAMNLLLPAAGTVCVLVAVTWLYWRARPGPTIP